MIANNVPGLYYFFIGEERGGIGSNALSGIFTSVDYLQNIKRCVSFDRRRTTSVITHQLGRQCCSNEFGQALAKEFSKGGVSLSLDTTGVYTDSASFMDDIAECTNISVGYYNEHRTSEMINITFLEKLAIASTKVDWDSLPTVRKVGFNQEILAKYKDLISEIKKSKSVLEVKVIGELDKVFIRIDLEDGDIANIYDCLDSLQSLLSRHKVNTEVLISDTYLKIELT
jgi:transcriptional regulator with XRE-family HTH domain